MSDKRFTIVACVQPDGSPFTVSGRDAWALNELIKAGPKGCTPVDNPAMRWASYVHNLRSKYGLDIETIHEAHGGPFAGTHARYILRSDVRILETIGECA